MDVLDAVLVVVGGLLCWFAALGACEPVPTSAGSSAARSKRHWVMLLVKAALLLGGVPLIVSAFITAPSLFQFVVAIGATWALMEFAATLTRGHDAPAHSPEPQSAGSGDSAEPEDPVIS
jgi:hypothetical protein